MFASARTRATPRTGHTERVSASFARRSTQRKRRFDIATASAINTLLEICVNTRAPANARISAAQEILNRSSIGPIISRTANANLNVGTGIEALLEKLDAAKEQGVVIDVECDQPD